MLAAAHNPFILDAFALKISSSFVMAFKLDSPPDFCKRHDGTALVWRCGD